MSTDTTNKTLLADQEADTEETRDARKTEAAGARGARKTDAAEARDAGETDAAEARGDGETDVTEAPDAEETDAAEARGDRKADAADVREDADSGKKADILSAAGGSGPGRSVTIAIPMPGRASLGKVLVFLALVAAVAVAGWQWRHAAALEEKEHARQEISSVAGRFGQALLSYEHADLAEARERVLSLATPDFGKTYEVAFTGTLQKTITELKADATATVRVVYVTGGTDGSAQAVVVMDSEVKSTAGTRNVTGSYLQMDLVEQKGRWKVSAVNSIGAINESLTGAPGAPDAEPEPSPKPSTP